MVKITPKGWFLAAVAISLFLLAWAAAVRSQEAPRGTLKPGELIAVDLSDLTAFRAFAVGIGAREERQPWSAQHKARCEAAGWGWSGTSRMTGKRWYA